MPTASPNAKAVDESLRVLMAMLCQVVGRPETWDHLTAAEAATVSESVSRLCDTCAAAIERAAAAKRTN